jgi:hypothetical protein
MFSKAVQDESGDPCLLPTNKQVACAVEKPSILGRIKMGAFPSMRI